MRILSQCALAAVTVASAWVAVAGCSVNDAISPDTASVCPTGTPPLPPPNLTCLVQVSFAQTGCEAGGTCHGNAASAGGGFLSALDTASVWRALTQVPDPYNNMILVTTGIPSNSLVLSVPTSGNHVGGILWSSQPGGNNNGFYQQVHDWIAAGAKIH